MKQKKKRIAAFALALCLVTAICPVSAFAFTGDESGAAGSTTVTYTATPTYTIEIPSSITIPANGSGEISISCSENGLGANTLLNVMVDAKTFQSDGNFYLTNTSDDSQVIKCALSFDGSAVSGSRVIRQYKDGGTSSTLEAPLIISRSESAPAAGTYTGTIYFSAAVTHTD